ncbi:unnamed protein product [Amoebophrya sp. A120]|nr:unnamed protein product [Amoebophrya sp. A120]|eukprot:GSA120T00013584001.1
MGGGGGQYGGGQYGAGQYGAPGMMGGQTQGHHGGAGGGGASGGIMGFFSKLGLGGGDSNKPPNPYANMVPPGTAPGQYGGPAPYGGQQPYNPYANMAPPGTTMPQYGQQPPQPGPYGGQQPPAGAYGGYPPGYGGGPPGTGPPPGYGAPPPPGYGAPAGSPAALPGYGGPMMQQSQAGAGAGNSPANTNAAQQLPLAPAPPGTEISNTGTAAPVTGANTTSAASMAAVGLAGAAAGAVVAGAVMQQDMQQQQQVHPPGQQQQVFNYGSFPVTQGAVLNPPPQQSLDIFGPEFTIKQKVTKRDLLENTLGVEMGNFYNVQPFGHSGDKNSELPWKMYVDEKSDNWCGRICCGPTRGLTFDVFYPKKEKDGGMKILELNKPFICCEPCCACCCCFCTGFCKPKFTVTATEHFPGNTTGGKYEIGYVQDHCQLCGTREEIHKIRSANDSGSTKSGCCGDSKYTHLYTIKGTCCQLGACLPAGGSAKYPIYKGDNNKEKVGMFTKMGKGVMQFVQELLADAQTFKVTCPPDARAEEKALLLAAGLMVDLQYYEQTNDKPEEMEGYGNMIGGLFYPDKASSSASSEAGCSSAVENQSQGTGAVSGFEDESGAKGAVEEISSTGASSNFAGEAQSGGRYRAGASKLKEKAGGTDSAEL